MDKPNNWIGEVTLIGTGGGYGESILVHLGFNNWIVIDSCVNPNTNESLPLWYLESIGVDVSKDVKLIICTHWHDDHIIGISTLLKKCLNAKFCMSKASDTKKFLQCYCQLHLKLSSYFQSLYLHLKILDLDIHGPFD